MHQTVSRRLQFDQDSADAIGYPILAHSPAIVLANDAGREWLLLIEHRAGVERDPLRTHGWLAQEILVADVDALASSLADSPFKILRPPANLDVSDRIRACQALGPAGELLYLTQVEPPVPPFELPHCLAAVDHLFIPVLSTPDRDASLREYEVLAAQRSLRFDTRITVVNQALGLPLETRHPVGTLQLNGASLIEIDCINGSKPAPADVCLGTATIIFHARGTAPANSHRPETGLFAGMALQSHKGFAGERAALLYST
ncbi:MAG: hypothetical protein AB8B57_03345 [Congregibacter sp.]